jgi:FkbM family methyltransferase
MIRSHIGGAVPEEITQAPMSAIDASVRAQLLDLYDLNMLTNAANYDLREKSERKRSVRDLERLFFQAVRAAQPDLFVEAGAKDAGASRRARTILDEARIVAFEANPYVHQQFAARNADQSHRVEYRHLALSDAPGRVTFHVRRSPDGEPKADGRGSLKKRVGDDHGHEQVEVEATTLDAYFTDSDITTCALWVDVEGAADKVLSGARDLLSRAAVVFIEVEHRGDWVWGPAWTVDDVSAYLFDLGLVAVARDYQTRHQYNVVYVSAPLLHDHRVRSRLAIHRSAALRGPRREGRETAEPSPPSRGRAMRVLRRLAGRVRRSVRVRRRRA